MNNDSRFTVVLSGSLHEPNLARFLQIRKEFEDLGIPILSPHGGKTIDATAEVVRFSDEPTEWTDEFVQQYHLDMLETCTLHYVVITEGYVGQQTTKEIERGFELEKPTFCSEHPRDPSLSRRFWQIATPLEVSTQAYQLSFNNEAFSKVPTAQNLRDLH